MILAPITNSKPKFRVKFDATATTSTIANTIRADTIVEKRAVITRGVLPPSPGSNTTDNKVSTPVKKNNSENIVYPGS